jgi:hypothetical protein
MEQSVNIQVSWDVTQFSIGKLLKTFRRTCCGYFQGSAVLGLFSDLFKRVSAWVGSVPVYNYDLITEQA